jgi:hypothetical protein
LVAIATALTYPTRKRLIPSFGAEETGSQPVHEPKEEPEMTDETRENDGQEQSDEESSSSVAENDGQEQSGEESSSSVAGTAAKGAAAGAALGAAAGAAQHYLKERGGDEEEQEDAEGDDGEEA